jgi:hypothetical protein
MTGLTRRVRATTAGLVEWGGLAMVVGGLVVMGTAIAGRGYGSAVGGLAIAAFGLMMFVAATWLTENKPDRGRRSLP